MADDALLGVAETIARRAPVDWHGVEQTLTDEADRAVLRELRSLAAMAALHADDAAAKADKAEGPLNESSVWNGLKLVESIGEGSFGRVFRAWDPQLDREVALKLLHPGVLPVPGAITEGRLLARVKHPNVVMVHSAAEISGELGLTMEFIHGRTLESLLETLGPFGARETTGIGVDLCHAVAAVHAAGLLHRDIKAQNVMREKGGRIVLMDFGASAWASGSSDLVGTPLYLAPEVLAGGRATPASDLYSLGVLLFHLLTGSYPVRTSSVDALLETHRSGRAQRLRDLRPDLPDRLVATVERAMALNPEDRFASPGALEDALAASLEPDEAAGPATTAPRWLTRRAAVGLAVVAALTLSATQATSLLTRPSAGHAPRYSSIGVLPIRNLTGDPANDYLSDGLMESMVGNLSRIRQLEVKAYRSSKAHGAADKTASSIASELGAQRLVEGSIRRMPDSDRLLVTASLVDPQSGQTVWSRTEQPDASGWQEAERTLFELLEFEIRGTVVTPRQVIVEAAAYEDFLRGRYQLNKRTADAALASREFFQRAIERQPSFAAAHAGLADTYLLLGAFLWLPADDMFPKAMASARQALLLDETLAAPHATLGYLLEVHGQWPAAEREFERAIALDPNYPTARHWYALSLVHHDHALAVTQIERAYALDPLSEIIGADVAKVYGDVGRVDEAIKQMRRVLSIHPAFVEGQHQLAELLERDRRYPEALAVLEAGAKVAPREPRMLAGLAALYGRLGRSDDARKVYERLRAQAPAQSTTIVFLMIAAVGAGDLDGALAYAQRGIQARDGAVVRLLSHDDYVLERFAALRGRPAFEDLIKQARAIRTQ